MLTFMLSWFSSRTIMGQCKWLHAHFSTSYRLYAVEQHECHSRMLWVGGDTSLWVWKLIVQHAISLYQSGNMYFNSTAPRALSSSTDPHIGWSGSNKLVLLSVEASEIMSWCYSKTANMAGWQSHSICSITYIINIKGCYIAAIIRCRFSISSYIAAYNHNLAVRPKP